MNPLEATTPDIEIDEFTGKLKKVELKQNSFIQTGINRNLLYVKQEVDAKLNALTKITVSNTAPSNPNVNDLWVDTT
jgi:hypothetical protein